MILLYTISYKCIQRARETEFLLPYWWDAGVSMRCHLIDEERALKIWRKSWKNLKKILKTACVVPTVCLVSRNTWCIILYARMDCIRITIDEYNFCREINNSAFTFVKVFLLFLFNVFVLLLIYINCRQNTQGFSRSVGGMFLSLTVFFGGTYTPNGIFHNCNFLYVQK